MLALEPFNHDDAITLTELCKTTRADRGKRLNLAVAQRWARRGYRGLLLPTVKLGGQFWLMRQWFDAWQAERIKRSMRTELPPAPPRARTPLQQSRGHERAVKQLRKLGVMK